MVEASVSTIHRDEEYVAVPVDHADRQRFTPIDATATRLPASTGANRSTYVAIGAVLALIVAFAAGFVMGTSGDEPTAVPVEPVATAAADPSALRGDPGMFPAGRGNDPRSDGAQDAR